MRKWLFICVIVLGFLSLGGQLFHLQVIDSGQNQILAEENRLEKQVIPAPRGLIYDRNGIVIADNLPVYEQVKKEKNQKVDRIEALRLQANGQDKDLIVSSLRSYPYKDMFAHLIGYLGSINIDELNKEKLDLQGYSNDALLGRIGVENQYESTLKGRDGGRLVEVDTQGSAKRIISQILPSPGKSLTLAVNKKLQEAATKAMGNRKGAVVASDPSSGEILLLYSSPSFDPELFVKKDNIEKLTNIVTDEENKPLFDRAIAGLYPPGSTFKLVTSVAGLIEGKITANTTYIDTGVVTVGTFKYTNWYLTGYGRTEGEISLAKALARSTDTYFYKVGEWVGEKKLIDWAKKFGLDNLYNIDIPGEVKGFIATPEWKMDNRGEPWFLGNTYHMAIGQGDLITTPLAVNMMTAAVANDGKICTPRILKIGAENTPYQEECRDLNINLEYLDEIKKGMTMACSTGGTAWPLFEFNQDQAKIACKTGTAETGDGKTSHAWITVIAPVDDSKIVLTVLLERGGEGSSEAGPVAKEILKVWFEQQ